MEFSDLGGLLAVGALLAVIGQVAKRLVFKSGKTAGSIGWRGVYYVTMPLHAILVGIAIGASNMLPAPRFLGDRLLGKVIWYALAGAIAPMCFSAVQNILKQKAARNESDS